MTKQILFLFFLWISSGTSFNTQKIMKWKSFKEKNIETSDEFIPFLTVEDILSLKYGIPETMQKYSTIGISC
jgi:hypothetical protein